MKILIEFVRDPADVRPQPETVYLRGCDLLRDSPGYYEALGFPMLERDSWDNTEQVQA